MVDPVCVHVTTPLNVELDCGGNGIGSIVAPLACMINTGFVAWPPSGATVKSHSPNAGPADPGQLLSGISSGRMIRDRTTNCFIAD
jgi:hypothetical protein